MPSPLSGQYTVKQLIQNTHRLKPSRERYMNRDVLKRITIQKITVYDNKQPGEARTKFLIKSYSYPQYYPYYTRKDHRGRTRSYQRQTKHEYDVILQLDRLSINVPFKARTGSQAEWDKTSKPKRLRSGRVEESKNYKKGINPDFLFRLEWVYKMNNILYGRCRAKDFPRITNPEGVVFADKHLLRVLKYLIDRGILKDD